MSAASRPRLAMTFTSDMDPRQVAELASLSEQAGLDELWVFEDCFSWTFPPVIAAALGATRTLKVGVALAPVPLRALGLLAMEFGTLARMFPGRVLPGIGAGVEPWMIQTGVGAASPMTRLRESAVALRALLDGEKVTTSGRYVTLDQVQLMLPPEETLPLYIGAGGPKMLALAGELGTGTLLATGLTEEQIVDKVGIVQAASAAAGTTGHETVLFHLVATGDDAAARLDAGLVRWGSPAGTVAGAAGDAAAIAASIRRLGELGIDSVSLMCTPDVEDIPGFVRFLGDEVVPLV